MQCKDSSSQDDYKLPSCRYGRVYFVAVDYNSIPGLTTETVSQKLSICAAVAAAAGTLRAAGLGTAAQIANF